MPENSRLVADTRQRIFDQKKRRPSPWRWTGFYLMVLAIFAFFFIGLFCSLPLLILSAIAFELARRRG